MPQPTYSAGLTTREVEVLRLVAQGLSDKEVANQLIVSPGTVSNHLQAINSKLGVSSRAAATRFALDHHLHLGPKLEFVSPAAMEAKRHSIVFSAVGLPASGPFCQPNCA